jgi:hypothetical protein
MLAVMSLVVGTLLTAGSAYYCLRSVDGRQIDLSREDLQLNGPDGVGPLPHVGRLHVQKGVFWLVASDRLPGVWWVHLERVAQPSSNPSLDIRTVPSWAEPPPPIEGLPDEAQHRVVGTLAVGWPWLAVAQRWIEDDPLTGFIPILENDDDGSTTARAAARFGKETPAGRPFILWSGLVGDSAFFAALAAPVLFWLRRRFAAKERRPGM